MPKATWGSDLDEEAIESAESRGVYAGDLPPAGVYRFKLKTLKKAKSKQGNPMVRFFGVIDGTWKDKHAKFDGAPLWVDTAVMESTAWRIKALVQGLGVTAREFMASTVTDDAEPEANIIKIGKKKISEGLEIYVNVKKEDGENGERLTVVGGGFIPAPDKDEDEAAAADEGDGDAPEEATPKAKGKKDKAKKAKGGEEPPF